MDASRELICVLPGPAPVNPAAPHILLILDGFPRSLGGGERIALRLAALLPQYGFRVSLLTFAIDPASPVLTQPAPCPIYLLPLTRTYDLNALRSARALGRFLRQHEVRIVQTFFESSDLWAGLVVKLLSSAHLIWSRRDMGILRAPKHRIAYRLMRMAPARVFAVSEQVRQFTIETDRIPAHRVEVIHNGLDLAPGIKRPQRTGDDFHIVTVGNIRHVKGHDVLIDAAAQILKRYPAATFTIAGDILEPEYFAHLEHLIASHELSASVHFTGGLEDLRPLLASADLFVLPSRSEGFSNAILEAMAAELPVVATRVGGNAESVEDGVTGTIVPPEDPAALAAAVLALLSQPAQLEQAGTAGRQRVLDHFTTAAMMGKTVRVYQQLLDRS